MLTFQEIHAYNKIAEQGNAKKILCPMDNEHGMLTPAWGDDEFVSFICLSCKAKIKPGYKMVVEIKKVLNNFIF